VARLQVGQAAPKFKTKNLAGSDFGIEDFKGKKIWLAFFRYARCPLCNLYLSHLLARMPLLTRNGVKIIAVFESQPHKFPKYLGGQPSELFNIIPDPEKKIYKLYGLEESKMATLHPTVWWNWLRAQKRGFMQWPPDATFNRLPAHFLIDENGIVQVSHYATNAADNISWSKVAEFAGVPA
jgi:peroxiredoxin Q/BCP